MTCVDKVLQLIGNLMIHGINFNKLHLLIGQKCS